MTVRHLKNATVILFLSIFGSAANAQSTRRAREFFLDNRGHALHVTVRAPVKKGPVLSTLVFEGGLGGGAETWSGVIARLPKALRIITYDRPGLGKSQSDGESPTPEHIADVLEAALHKVTSPPYFLVGHSWGGPLIRAFAGRYPREVAGLVFIDPTSWTETDAGRSLYVFGPLGHGPDAVDLQSKIEEYFYKDAGDFAPALQAEIDVSRKARRNDFSSFAGFPTPSVPLVVLLTTKWPSDLPQELKLPFDTSQYQNLVLSYRILSMAMFCHSVLDGTLVTTSKSGHYIQVDEPELVVWAIRRVLRLGRDSREKRSGLQENPG